MPSSPPTLESVATELVGTVPVDVLEDLRVEDAAVAIELHFAPVRVRALGLGGRPSSLCSTDGLYDATTGAAPTILYADDVAPERARFTLLHELGHHLLTADGAHLLDAIDDLAGSRVSPAEVEEKVCHEFAGRALIDDEAIESVLGSNRLRPADVIELHERCNASWEAVAVRLAASSQHKTAIVLLRSPGVVSFCAASRRLTTPWWPRGSTVQSGGPLDHALRVNQTARPEIYRSDLAFAESMYCDSLRVHDGLAIAVLSDKPSDGHFDILEDPEPIWKTREDFCERCNEERTVGWCDNCRGRYCPECERCACSPGASNPVCPSCGLVGPKRVGATNCLTCEADGVA
jgi:hypothetical protein